MNGKAQGDGSLKSFYGYKETFGKSTKWVDVPKDLTFVHTSNPYEDEDGEDVTEDTSFGHDVLHTSQTEQPFTLSQAAYPAYATHGLEALSAVASDQYSYAPPPATMGQQDQPPSSSNAPSSSSPQHSNATPSQNLEYILNPSSNLSPVEHNIDPRLHSQTPSIPPTLHSPIQVCNSFPTSGGKARSRSKGLHRRAAIEDPSLAFLLRDYSERAGLWMDLYDLDHWFGAKVPVLAVNCPLLLYSCASLSAKSLARVEGRKPVMGGQVSPTRRSKMEYWPDPPLDAEGWIRKGREYYDIAVSLLRQALAGASRPSTSSLPDDATSETLSWVQEALLPTTDSDELVSATAILCVYEFLDASGPEWSQHLDGAKTLFDIAKDRMVPLTLPPSPILLAQQVTQQLDPYSTIRGLSPGRKAVFWNFARQDMLSAFINNTSTRLDTEDLPMWRNAGLKLTAEGFVSSSNSRNTGIPVEQTMADDMISNALVWLVMKLVNFIAAGDAVPEDVSPLGHGFRQHQLLELWKSLEDHLVRWYGGLPDGFHPTAVRVREHEFGMEEEFFPRPMCASTMEWYHFARIQLLHNKPHVTTATPISRSSLGLFTPGSLALRHASYAAILQQSRAHAKEIVAIGLGRSDEGTRIHAVQPLWTAGLVLGTDHQPGEDGETSRETEAWRRTVIELLRSIERDMGWASEYRVQNLLQVWGDLSPEWGQDGMNVQ